MKFKFGQVVMTRAINDEIADDERFAKEVLSSFKKYARCDWGDTHPEDKLLNNEAVEHGERILAAYETSKGKIWINTEWDRSYTTIMFPSEY